jgi:class 3 adenylate cyclase
MIKRHRSHLLSEQSELFRVTAGAPRHAVALVYDLEGFSKFFNQPDVQHYVPLFLNRINSAMGAIIHGGMPYWQADAKHKMIALPPPVHEKFLGDGALYLWLTESFSEERTSLLVYLCNRLWDLRSQFHALIDAIFDEIPVFDVPRRIRFGLASGTVYELRRNSRRASEYVGFCINLASRLQKYCPELGFIASARLNLPEPLLSELRYVRVIATEIKGFPREIVIVDKSEYLALDEQVRRSLFAELPGRPVE